MFDNKKIVIDNNNMGNNVTKLTRIAEKIKENFDKILGKQKRKLDEMLRQVGI